jgi:hypothetical protein
MLRAGNLRDELWFLQSVKMFLKNGNRKGSGRQRVYTQSDRMETQLGYWSLEHRVDL